MKYIETEKNFPKSQARKRNKSFWQYAPFAVAIVVLLILIAGNIYNHLDQPRKDALVVSNIEANNGEVIRIVHRPGKATQGYVEVVFDGKRSRCILHLLDQNPPVFDCEPAINR